MILSLELGCSQPPSEKLLFAVGSSQWRDAELVRALRMRDWVLSPPCDTLSPHPPGLRKGCVRGTEGT